jgi:isopentenyl-diphosphate delta-isomerase
MNLSPQELILVDDHNQPIGSADIYECHVTHPQLHRALSIFLFDELGRILLQRRSAHKLLWPGFWSNSCCTHPRVGEDTHSRALQRLQEELAVQATTIEFAFSFVYRAVFEEIGVEHEYCEVFTGNLLGTPCPNPQEVQEVCFVTPKKLTQWMSQSPHEFTPWSIIEWKRLQELQHLQGAA